MKKALLLLLLVVGASLTTFAQHGRGHGHGHHKHWNKHWDKHRDRCDDDRYDRRRVYYRDRDYRRDWDDDYYRPRRRVVVYERPVPVYPVYPARPRVVFNAGVTVVH